MFDAQFLTAAADGTLSVFSPWLPRQADNARFTLDVVEIGSQSKLKVAVYHKNRDETGDGTSASETEISRQTVGRTTSEWTGLKELVRYKYTITVVTIGGNVPEVLFRTLDPCWFDSVLSS